MRTFIIICFLLPGHSSAANSNQSNVNKCLIFNRTLVYGAHGQDVKVFQEFLKSKRYLNANATGFFGPSTFKALQDFQSANSLGKSGNFGPATRALIHKMSCSETEEANKKTTIGCVDSPTVRCPKDSIAIKDTSTKTNATTNTNTTVKVKTDFGTITIPDGWEAVPDYYQGAIYGYLVKLKSKPSSDNYNVSIGSIQGTCADFPASQGYYCKQLSGSETPIFTQNKELSYLVDSIYKELSGTTTTTTTSTSENTKTTFGISIDVPSSLKYSYGTKDYGGGKKTENIFVSNGINKVLEINKYTTQSAFEGDTSTRTPESNLVNDFYSIGAVPASVHKDKTTGVITIAVYSKFTFIVLQPISASGITQEVLNKLVASIKIN